MWILQTLGSPGGSWRYSTRSSVPGHTWRPADLASVRGRATCGQVGCRCKFIDDSFEGRQAQLHSIRCQAYRHSPRHGPAHSRLPGRSSQTWVRQSAPLREACARIDSTWPRNPAKASFTFQPSHMFVCFSYCPSCAKQLKIRMGPKVLTQAARQSVEGQRLQGIQG